MNFTYIAILPNFINVCNKFKINTPLRMAHFFAQISHESGNFKSLRENLNYSVDGLLKTFSRERISTADAQKFGRTATRPANQTAIANIVYGGNWGRINLGNTQPGDGSRFIGRGLIQLTGRANYTAYAKASGYDVVKNPQLLSEDYRIALDAAAWFWSNKNLNPIADANNIKQITKVINGGDKGLDDRIAKFNTFMKTDLVSLLNPKKKWRLFG